MSMHPRVLIVDDEAPLRRQVMVGLAQHGFEVDECDEGFSALSKIKAAESRQNPFGCVLDYITFHRDDCALTECER